jgi:hypothetical protein
MIDQVTSIQSNSFPPQKPYTSHLQPTKIFQPYIPPIIITNNTSNSLSKNN